MVKRKQTRNRKSKKRSRRTYKKQRGGSLNVVSPRYKRETIGTIIDKSDPYGAPITASLDVLEGILDNVVT